MCKGKTKSLCELIYNPNGKDVMDYDMLLFPVHKPQHWCLVVSISVLNYMYIYLWINNPGLQVVNFQSKETHCIDSVHCSNEDAVNWMW